MKQLTLKDLYKVANQLVKNGEDLSKFPIYLGDDDELNGIHCGWFINILDINCEDDKYCIDMINESFGNMPLKNKGILIS